MKKSVLLCIMLLCSVMNVLLWANPFPEIPSPILIENSNIACEEEINDVTFVVDMTGQTVSPNGVHVAGDFQGWSPNGTPLTNQGNGIWSVTVPNVTPGTIQYKFLNGNAWGTDESAPSPCGSNGNRTATITGTQTLPTVCFGQCIACPTATYSVTFSVDMTGKTVSTSGVHIAGSFQGWNPSGTPLTNMGNNIWSVTVPNIAGAISYKFVNGNAWGSDEFVPATCASGGNRSATITANTTLPTVCYALCGACPAQTYSVTFNVDMTGQTVGANGVHVAGSFQGWNPSGTPLTNLGGGIWSVTVPGIAPGQIDYKFVNGNSWGSDEGVPAACASGGNRTRNVTANATLPLVCYAQCAACPTVTYSVTFRVDMTGKTVSPNGIHIAGNFQNWTPNTTPLTNQGNGIWSVTVPNIAGDIEYKFINGNDWSGVESVNGTCVTNTNRTASITANTTTPLVCFNECAACPAQTYSVVFKVDMTGKTVAPAGVHVAGSFQGWNAATTPLTNLGNGQWAVTVTGIVGTIEYKFINGNAWGTGLNEDITGVCGTNTNRTATIAANTILPSVCFNECAACISQITAKVFMNNTIGTLINSDLTANSNFPTSDPYSTAPINTKFVHVNNGATMATTAAVLAVTGANAIADWVFLEFRTGTTASTTVAYTKAALLQKDGDIVDMDGVSAVSLPLVAAGDYYIAVRHRNHIGFRTENTIAISAGTAPLDFTNNSIPLHGTVPLVALSPTISVMTVGDADMDGSIDGIDSSIWEVQNGNFGDYTLNSDYNLDGSIDGIDSAFWEINNGKYQEID
jgi:1,4-alpha-glucan branching enzyme